MIELIIFCNPLSANSTLTIDNGFITSGHPAVHSSGRLGIGFTIPNETPNNNGARIRLDASGKISIDQRGILRLDPIVEFLADDFYLQDVPIPQSIPVPPNPQVNNDPLSIINQIYAIGNYSLRTKESCGKFTEECCKQLHNRNSNKWGHVKKTGAQNQYNGHAVDAIQLLNDNDSSDTESGIYDIIIDSESTNAKPAFNFAGPPDESKWYYPA